MTAISENNKRIAKNTTMLYFRMLLTMGVSLYTVRVILNTLGAADYGIFNVVGGIVTMFTFLSGSMASASQRFFAFELGRKNYEQLKKTFAITITIYVMIAIIILILAETVGLWFLNTQMTIPEDRLVAANWVYQFAIFSFMMTVLTIPYNAAIIAHERMKVYAYVSIADVVLKLLIVYLLVVFSYDKLKLYAVLTFVVTSIITLIYRTYCKWKFEECRFAIYWNKPLFKEIISYSGWNIIGAIASVLRHQGINILLNIFFNPIVNAAYAVARQIQAALLTITNNLYVATRPQITKYYAQEELELMWKLVFVSIKISYYLFIVLSIPLFFEVEYVLFLWLGKIPQYAPVIIRFILVVLSMEILSNQLIAVLQAANKLKVFQIISSGILLLNLPVSFVLLKFGGSVYSPFIASIFITVLYIVSQIVITKKEVAFSVYPYLKEIFRLILVTFITIVPPYFVYKQMDFGLLRLVAIISVSFIVAVTTIWTIGLNLNEKKLVTNYIKTRRINNKAKKD